MSLIASTEFNPTKCQPGADVRETLGYTVKSLEACPLQGEACLAEKRRILGFVTVSTEFMRCSLGQIEQLARVEVGIAQAYENPANTTVGVEY